jgi:hypothetical protein
VLPVELDTPTWRREFLWRRQKYFQICVDHLFCRKRNLKHLWIFTHLVQYMKPENETGLECNLERGPLSRIWWHHKRDFSTAFKYRYWWCHLFRPNEMCPSKFKNIIFFLYLEIQTKKTFFGGNLVACIFDMLQ